VEAGKIRHILVERARRKQRPSHGGNPPTAGRAVFTQLGADVAALRKKAEEKAK
jgi:hypothetical protein